MDLFSKKTTTDGTQDKTRRRDRLFRSFATHTKDSDVKTVTTKHPEPQSQAKIKTADPSVDAVVKVDAVPHSSPTPVKPTKEAAPAKVDILTAALSQLNKQDHDAIRPFIKTQNGDIVSVLKRALAAARDQKQACDDKRWTLSFGGHTVIVKEKVDKITTWIDRFKDIGDLVAGIDPAHVGLPWAAVKLLLEASVADANQMASLLVGCETALYMTNRLQVYMNFLSSVPPVQSRRNLEEALTKMYACVFQFLAQALQIYQQSTWKRAFLAFWQPSDVNDFEQTCTNLGHELEIEASNADRTMSEHDRVILLDVRNKMESALKDLDHLHTIQASLDRIERKMDLAKLRTVPTALFDSYDQVHVPCHPATRQDVLGKIHAWAQDPDGKRIFWLAGMAGIGKSTISVSVCEWLRQQQPKGVVDLGGSFFFKRGEGDRGSAALLIPTIVGELVHKLPGLDVFVASVLDTDICSKALPEQFKKLILEPLPNVLSNTQCRTLVVVIDALDECTNIKDIQVILTLWQDLPHVHNKSLKLFVTARPEVPISRWFPRVHAYRKPDIELHKVPDDIIRDDIFTYLNDSLTDFRVGFNDCPPTGVPLPEDWPTKSALLDIVNIAVPLFVVASTIYRFLIDENADPEDQLTTILSKPRGGQMAQTYMPVLDRFTSGVVDPANRDNICCDFRTIVGTIICLGEPLARPVLADLLDLEDKLVTRRLNNLRSVLQIPEDIEVPIRPLHLSFGEFLVSKTCNDGAFRIDPQLTHLMLWQRCLRLLSGIDGLRENICSLSYSGHLRSEVSPATVNQHLPLAMQYACRYWIYHVQSSALMITDGDEVHTFLEQHFLHWLEVLSLLNRLADAIKLLDILLLRTRPDNSGQVAALIEDARRFLLANRFVAELAPLQLYSSALAFAPENSVVRRQCGPIATYIQQTPIMPLTWSSELQKLEGHTSSVWKVAFSPDNSLLASASDDQTVRIWNPSTGEEIQKLEGHDNGVFCVAFSSDNSVLASASRDHTIRLWNPHTGQMVCELEGHTDGVFQTVFSHDSSMLASASCDHTVRLWDPSTGREIRTLSGHADGVGSVAFSFDDLLLASASDDQTVRIWNPHTGQEIRKLEKRGDVLTLSHNGLLLVSVSEENTILLQDLKTNLEPQELFGHHGFPITALQLSYDDSLLASASGEGKVRLWNTHSGQMVRELEGYTDGVSDVVFSPLNNSILASASFDHTVRIWDVSIRESLQKLGHLDIISEIVFSYDGSLLASASNDGTIRLWSPSNGRSVQTLEGHNGPVACIVFSHDDSILASSGTDWTVRVWNLSTGEEALDLRGHTASIYAVAVSHDNSVLVSASCDHTVRLWNLSTGQESLKLEGHMDWVIAVAFSYNDSQLASATTGEIRLWDLSTGRELQRIGLELQRMHWTYAVAFSHDSSCLASVWQPDHDSNYCTMQVRNLSTGEVVQTLDYLGRIDKISFTANNDGLLTNRGLIKFDGTNYTKTGEKPDASQVLFIERDWLLYKGKRILWLPHDYREHVNVYEDVVAFGHHSGHVRFMRVGFDKEPL